MLGADDLIDNQNHTARVGSVGDEMEKVDILRLPTTCQLSAHHAAILSPIEPRYYRDLTP